MIQLALVLLCNLANLIHDIPPLLDVVNPPPTSWIGVPVWNLLLGIQLALTNTKSSQPTLAVGCQAYAQLTSVHTRICDLDSPEEDHCLLIKGEHAPDLPRESFCLHYPFGGFEDTRIRVGANVKYFSFCNIFRFFQDLLCFQVWVVTYSDMLVCICSMTPASCR